MNLIKTTKICLTHLLLLAFINVLFCQVGSAQIEIKNNYYEYIRESKSYFEQNLLDSASLYLYKAQESNGIIAAYDLTYAIKLKFKQNQLVHAKRLLHLLCTYRYNINALYSDSLLSKFLEVAEIKRSSLDQLTKLDGISTEDSVYLALNRFFIIDQYVRQDCFVETPTNANMDTIAKLSTEKIISIFNKNKDAFSYEQIGFEGMRNLFILLVHNVRYKEFYQKLKPLLDYLYTNNSYNDLMIYMLKQNEYKPESTKCK